jgi:hypothetical protein
MTALTTPILFIVFNRPDLTEKVFAAIRRQRPARLFVAADGARPGKEGEAGLVERTRAIATKVDWPCEVKTFFQPENLGCGKAVSGAISWFFEQVEEGIILEDDCLPHPDFFPFCQTLLERYRDDPKVLSISGDHFLPHRLHLTQPYYFSKYVQIWGWATWRRTWEHYRIELDHCDETEWMGVVERANPVKTEADYWKHILRFVRGNLVDTWDYQLMFSCWKQGGSHICPSRNLISNIGYRGDATHTNFSGSLAELPIAPLVLDGIRPPSKVDPQLDNLIFYTRFLESFSQTWWIEQALDPSTKLEGARWEAGHAKEDNKRKERLIEALERQNRLLCEKLKQLQGL